MQTLIKLSSISLFGPKKEKLYYYYKNQIEFNYGALTV
jgi:hypothetical protein